MTAATPITMSQAQLDAQAQSGAIRAVDPSICTSGYSRAIGGCLDAAPSGSSILPWIVGLAIVGGLAWYFWPQISAQISEWIPRLEAQP